MEHMATTKLLGNYHLLQTDDACCVNTSSVLFDGKVNIWEDVQLYNQSPELDEKLQRLVQFLKRVNDLADQVDWEVTSDEDPVAEL